MTRAHIIFTGTVQGVGFRFTVQRYALSFDLNGWVRNHPNGSVEIMLEGLKANIEKLCQSVEEHFDRHIQNKNIQFSPAQNEFNDFQITY